MLPASLLCLVLLSLPLWGAGRRGPPRSMEIRSKYTPSVPHATFWVPLLYSSTYRSKQGHLPSRPLSHSHPIPCSTAHIFRDLTSLHQGSLCCTCFVQKHEGSALAEA